MTLVYTGVVSAKEIAMHADFMGHAAGFRREEEGRLISGCRGGALVDARALPYSVRVHGCSRGAR